MHKRKGALADSPALFSLKLCIFFAFSCPFLCLFLSFYILFLSFSAFLSLPCPFVILLYPYPSSFCSLLSFFHLFASYIPPYFALYSPIIYFFSLSLICSLYFLLYFLILYILFVLRFYPCFIYWLYNVLSVYNFSCAFQLLCSPY